MKLGLIDLGSNSARMYLLSLKENGVFSLLARRRVMTRLSEGMSEDSCLQPVPMLRTCQVLADFAKELKGEDALPFAVATAAVRKATNQAEFLELVKEVAGFELHVIDGQTEAYFDFQGVMAGFENLSDCLICDTGGGSTELILANDHAIEAKVSLPFGAMTLFDTYGNQVDVATEAIKQRFKEVPFLTRAKGLPLIGIGGSVCALGGIDCHLQGEVAPVHGYTLTAQRVLELFELLQPMDANGRMAHGVEAGRADTICHGFLPSLILMQEYGLPTMTLCTGGLREGIMAELKKERPLYYAKHPQEFLRKYL